MILSKEHIRRRYDSKILIFLNPQKYAHQKPFFDTLTKNYLKQYWDLLIVFGTPEPLTTASK